MKRAVTVVIFVSVLWAVTYAQTKKPLKTAIPPKQNLSDEFAKTSLRALRAIDGELGEATIVNGKIAVPRGTYERIMDADVEARTEDEKAVVRMLTDFFSDRTMNNSRRGVISLREPIFADPHSVDRNATLMASDPEVLGMNSREGACSRALDDLLRARYFLAKPTVCNGVWRQSGNADAAQADPANAGSIYYFSKGMALTQAGNVDGAIAAFDKAIQADPAKADAYYWKGINLMGKATVKGGKMVAPEGTAEAFNKYLELEPNGKYADPAKQILASIGVPVGASR